MTDTLDMGFERLGFEQLPEVGATILPSGGIARFPFADLIDDRFRQVTANPDVTECVIDLPSTEIEVRRAEVLTSFLRVSPAFARVYDRGIQPDTSKRWRDILPPLRRVVFVPLHETLEVLANRT